MMVSIISEPLKKQCEPTAAELHLINTHTVKFTFYIVKFGCNSFIYWHLLFTEPNIKVQLIVGLALVSFSSCHENQA